MRTVWQFAMAAGLVFGRGAAGQVGMILAKRQLKRALLVTDSNLARLGIVEQVEVALRDSGIGVEIFDRCVAEPPFNLASEGAEVGRMAGVDCVVGLGGGSNLDIAKVAATVIAHSGNPRDYFGFDRIPGPVLPIIAIPTTAGTGSEVSHSAVLSDRENGTKVSTLSQWLRPAIAIVDPSLSDTCPATVTAHSGIDALVHAIEAVTARPFDQMVDVEPQSRAYEGAYFFTELLGGEAIRRIGRSLPIAVKCPENKDARDSMALAATLAGMAFSNSGVAIVHALEYPLGILTHCTHGEGNGLLLPHVMRFNLDAARTQFEKIANWLGDSLVDSHASNNAELAIERVVQLQSQIGIRTQLRELGLSYESIPKIASTAFQIKRLMDTNPRRPTESDLIDILKAAY